MGDVAAGDTGIQDDYAEAHGTESVDEDGKVPIDASMNRELAELGRARLPALERQQITKDDSRSLAIVAKLCRAFQAAWGASSATGPMRG